MLTGRNYRVLDTVFASIAPYSDGTFRKLYETTLPPVYKMYSHFVYYTIFQVYTVIGFNIPSQKNTNIFNQKWLLVGKLILLMT